MKLLSPARVAINTKYNLEANLRVPTLLAPFQSRILIIGVQCCGNIAAAIHRILEAWYISNLAIIGLSFRAQVSVRQIQTLTF